MRMVVASILTGNGNYGNVAPLRTNVRNQSTTRRTRRILSALHRKQDSSSNAIAWRELHSRRPRARIEAVKNPASPAHDPSPFSPGAMVVLTLASPREKFWGALLSLAPEGLFLRGVELPSFEDLLNLIKEGEPFTSGIVFFPMHRVERLELDLPDGAIPSLSQRFAAKTGMDPAQLLSVPVELGGRE